jgi:hypothetical protein
LERLRVELKVPDTLSSESQSAQHRVELAQTDAEPIRKKVKQAVATDSDKRQELAHFKPQESQQQTNALKEDLRSDVPPPRPLPTNAPIPQPEIQTCDNAFSTFSLNVSDVSFKLTAASLEKGQMPDVASVRSEEFINSFDYRDPEAPPGVPIAFAWERAIPSRRDGIYCDSRSKPRHKEGNQAGH